MTEAVALVLGHAFGDLGLRRVKAYAATDNAASQRVLIANGLSERGVERLGTVLETGRADSILFDVLAEEWDGQPHRSKRGQGQTTPWPQGLNLTLPRSRLVTVNVSLVVVSVAV